MPASPKRRKQEYHARHILVDDEAKAKDMIAQLDKGGSFEQLAKDNSKDGSATEGGDLGWFNPNQMVKPFSDALQQLEIGKYTATPVKSEFGWHVIKLEEKRATTPPPYRISQGAAWTARESEEVRDAPQGTGQGGQGRAFALST